MMLPEARSQYDELRSRNAGMGSRAVRNGGPAAAVGPDGTERTECAGRGAMNGRTRAGCPPPEVFRRRCPEP